LVKTRNNFVHEKDYVNEWTRLRIRVDTVMCELQKASLEAHDKALNTLNEWFIEVVNNMEQVEINRNQEKSKLYLSDTHIFLDASGIIFSGVHSKNLDLDLEKLKSDSVMEKENKELKKEVLEQRLFAAELQTKLIAQ